MICNRENQGSNSFEKNGYLHNSRYAVNARNQANGLDLLADMQDASVKAAFYDPQYRGVLDKLHYGNEGKGRGKARCSLPQMDDNTIQTFISEINRVLLPSGHLFLWIDKYHLCQGTLPWIDGTDLNLVDMVVWDKGKIGMGYRTRRKSEYLIVFQKTPVKAKACWTDHSIPDVWTEITPKTHPHSKPVELQRRLIAATTLPGDIIIDPAAGGFSVLAACQQLENRIFIGADICGGENIVTCS